MPVHIVWDHPEHHSLRRAARSIVVITGLASVLAGLAASLVPLALAVRAGIQLLTGADVDLDRAVRQAAVAVVVALVALPVGLVLLRGRRRVVLFLRRFGHQDATAVVTFAVARTIGSSWRLVTLDDAAIAPVGVAAWPRGLALSADSIRRLSGTAGDRMRDLFARVFQLAYSGGRRSQPTPHCGPPCCSCS